MTQLTWRFYPDAKLPCLRCQVGVLENRIEKVPMYADETSEQVVAYQDGELTESFTVRGFGRNLVSAFKMAGLFDK